ncbi:MAG: alanine racemase [Syntrophotalea acetylenica]|uniref:Alanine racemase n=1 Tax=Syntrophotalea acetylenica TaxID=29542 RepID=A0A1L3GHB4_SYNAC|nr:alanine racemase [Syntrophotalea acetylenica]APG25332.1 alanine racemase [Syntrophotalea acetylenica]APG43401.1 alanine racemase [Syntrophotalea acetylenica]MDD4456487.1 alanine racemase [Syntrophotalea acetylenica]MDY0262655.1 alanine racemase [Syntrophotalea acetylenica]
MSDPWGHRPTRVEIDLEALKHNFRQAQTLAGPEQGILAVVKADAYGHGAAHVATALQDVGARMFGVAIVEEGVSLREAGVVCPILVLGGLYPGQEQELLRFGLVPTLFDMDTARRLDACARTAGVVLPYHMKLDTGMSRVGFRAADLAWVLEELRTLPGLRMDGLFSHLALADEPKDPVNRRQHDVFRDCLARVRQSGFAPRYVHLSNSAALLTGEAPECNLARPGILLYGGLPSEAFAGRFDLRPVMSFRTRVAQVRSVPEGTGVSYGHRFVAGRPTVLAIIPVGYADGYSRHLSNVGEVLVRGRRARVAGTVCMDWTMIDVTDIPGVAVGDEVTLLGCDNGQCITADEWARRIGTISYEVFCQFSKRVPRVTRDD